MSTTPTATDAPGTAPFVVHAARGRLVGMLLIAGAFATIGVFMLFDRAKPSTVWVGALNVLVFGSGVLIFARQVLDRRPRVVIDDAGVFDRTLGVGVIAWDQIDDARMASAGEHVFVCLVLKDATRYTRTQSPLRRWMTHGNRALGFTALSINLIGTSAEPADVMQLIISRRRAAAAARPPRN